MGQSSRTVKVSKQSTTASEPPKMLFAISRFGQGYPVGPDHPQAMSVEECSKKTGQGVDELQDLWWETFGKHLYPSQRPVKETHGSLRSPVAKRARMHFWLPGNGEMPVPCEADRDGAVQLEEAARISGMSPDSLEKFWHRTVGRMLQQPARPRSNAILDLICRDKRERAVALSWAHLLAANERSDVFLLETDEASAISTQVEEMLNRALLEFIDGAGPVAEADAGEAEGDTADASLQGIESTLAEVLTTAEMAKLRELVGKYVEVVKAARTLYTASAVDPEEDVKPLDDHARRYVDQPANAINQLLANVRILPEAESGAEEDEGADARGEAVAAGA